MGVRWCVALGLLGLMLVVPGGGRAQTQQPPPGGSTYTPPAGSDASVYGIVCDGVAQTGPQLQQALDTLPAGTRLTLPPGICLLNVTLALTRPLTVQGAGVNQTYLRQTVTTIPVLTVSANDAKVGGLTVDHTGTPVAGGDGIVIDNAGGLNHAYLEDVAADRNWRGFALGCVAYGWGSHLQANNNNNNGFEFLYPASCATAQWQIHHSVSQLNRGVGFGGFNTTAAVGIGPLLYDTVTFGNEFGGYVFIGSAGHAIYDLFLHNLLSSADNRSGVFLDTYGGTHVVSNPWIELTGRADGYPQGSPATTSVSSQTGHGLWVTPNNLPGLAIHGGYFWNCSWSGVALDAPYSSLIGGVSIGNGLAFDAARSRRAGVHVGADGVTVSGHQFQYVSATGATLHYVHLSGSLTMLSVGQNTYGPGLAGDQFVDGSEATFVSTTPPTMAAGLGVFSNRADAPGVVLYDVTGGAAPLKILRVAGGQLQVLNAGATAVIQGLSDAGTPSWPQRRGQVTIADTANTATVTLTPGEPDANYFVQMTPVTAFNGPAQVAFTIAAVTKAAGSFVLTVAGAPGSGKSVVYDWLVYR